MKLLALLLALCAGPAYAQHLTCTPPTNNTNGSAFTAAQLPIKYKFYEGSTLGVYSNSTPLQSDCDYVFTGLAPGAHYFVATAVDNAGAQSAASVPASAVVPGPTPNPPGGLKVLTNTTAYTLVVSRNRVALIAVGTVAAGTVCDPTQPVMGLFVVPVEAVTFPGTVRPEAVVAACG